jgi:hypothetical protein
MPHYVSNILFILFILSFLFFIYNKNFNFIRIPLYISAIYYITNRLIFSLIDSNIGNADEFAYPYLSKKLLLGWNEFVNIDVGTSGPLNSAIMFLPYIINLDVNIITSRIMSFLILSITLIITYRIFNLLNRKLSPFYIIPMLLFYGAVGNSYHAAYTSEFFATLLIIYSIYIYLSIDSTKILNPIQLTITSIILPLSIFCKLQVAPLALVIWIFIAASTYKISFKKFLYVLFISLLTFFGFIYIFYANNSLEYFYISYIKNNTSRTNLLVRPGLLDNLKYLTSMTILNLYYVLFLISAIIYYKTFMDSLKKSFFVLILLLITLFIILFPKWNFDHYLHFLIFILPIFLIKINSCRLK